MTDRLEHVKALARSVFERRPGERAAFLDEACRGDDRLRAEIEAFISSEDGMPTAATAPRVPNDPAADEPAGEFAGTERFRLEQRLGAGGFGVVYRAYDRQLNRTIALKTFRTSAPEALYRLKREFRSLADLSHPNLVRLYDLVSEGSTCFFTMELVEGVTFSRFVRDDSPSVAATMEERLRSVLPQLVEGVAALHQAGRVHRDLKPSNVLVSNGRVRILDFGLAIDVSLPGSHHSSRIIGTPAYMSPEQGAQEEITPASDWYSVGVMLFEALTGQVPFSGSFLDVLDRKRRLPTPRPSDVRAEAPADLDDLCARLLERDPTRRPTSRELLELLRVDRRAMRAVVTPTPLPGAPFVGRAGELAELDQALAEVRGGATGVAAVHGASGIGKTALVRAFLERLGRDPPRTVLFTGRCYEQESVPYKALDSIVDGVAAYIRRLSPTDAEALLPRDVMPLARLFPVLGEVPAFSGAQRHVRQAVDSQELRRRAFGALRELLARLGETRTVVLFIDDLQWGDRDSAALLEDVLRPPDPPCLLLIGAYRTEDTATSPFLRYILPLRAQAGATIHFRELPLTEMSAPEATDLANALLAADLTTDPAQAAAIARDSGGHPFFLCELTRHARTSMTRRAHEQEGVLAERRGSASIDQVVRTRVARLPDGARRLLEVVCLAGTPLEQTVARRLASLRDEEADSLDVLKDERLVRTRALGEASRLEPYHDRIRAAVVGGIADSTRRAYHAALAHALESAAADAETLAFHFEAAGDRLRAAEHARRAADRALEKLAFDHAAAFYEQALRLLPEHADANRHRILLAGALASAGRGKEAATHYLEAAGREQGVLAHDLRRRAAQQLLICGHIREGLEVLESLLRTVGMRMPRSRFTALVSLVRDRVLLRLRGMRLGKRPEDRSSADRLVRIDTCWTVTVGLTFVEPLMAAVFQARHVLAALRVGEPLRAVRALAMEAGYISTGGLRTRPRVESLLEQSRRLAVEVPNAYPSAIITFAEGFAAYFQGRWNHAQRQLEACEAQFREACTDVAWELNASQLYGLRSLYYLGRTRDIERKLGPLLDDVARRGDLFLEAALRTTFVTFLALVHDDVAKARREIEQVSALALHERFRLQLFWALEARVLLALYVDEGEEALAAIAARARDLQQSELGRIQQNGIFANFWRGRSMLASATAASDLRQRNRRLREVTACAERIRREGTEWGAGFGHLLDAGRAILEGRPAEARAELHKSVRAFEAADVVGAAAQAALFRCGELTGGAEGQSMIAAATAWFHEQGYAKPERFVRVYVPLSPSHAGDPHEEGGRMKTLGLALVLAALPFVAAAQDVVKVDPDHYTVLIDNAAVRVLKVEVAAGAKSPMHSHPDALVVPLTTGNARYAMPDGKTVDGTLTKETASFTPAATHTSANVGTTKVEAVLVEFKTKAPGTAVVPTGRAGLEQTVLVDSPRAVAYKAVTAPDFQEPAGSTHDYDQVVIALGPGSLTLDVDGKKPVTSWQRGDVQFIGRGVKHQAKNTGGKPFDVIIVAIR